MRLHQVMNDLPVLIRQSRASYGVVFDEPYDNTKHGPKDYVYTNPVDGQRYAKDQIHWIIAQESPLDGRPIAPFETFHVIKESDTVSWEIEIVKHTTSPGQRISLPARLVRDRTDPRAHEIDIVQRIPCKFSPTLEELNVIQKLKRFRLLKIKRYWKIPYEIRVDVGPAALNFQLWFNNKVRSSGDFIQNLMEDIRAQITSPA